MTLLQLIAELEWWTLLIRYTIMSCHLLLHYAYSIKQPEGLMYNFLSTSMYAKLSVHMHNFYIQYIVH